MKDFNDFIKQLPDNIGWEDSPEYRAALEITLASGVPAEMTNWLSMLSASTASAVTLNLLRRYHAWLHE